MQRQRLRWGKCYRQTASRKRKASPRDAAELTVTGAVPVEVSVNDCAVEVPTVTLPKLRLPVLTVSWGLGAATLTPLRATSVVLPVDESLLIVNCPFASP